MEQPIPLWLQILIAIVTTIGVASPFAVVLYTRLNKIVPQFAAAMTASGSDVANQVKTENANLVNQLGQTITSTITLLQRSDDKVDRLEEKVRSLESKLLDRERISGENKHQIEELLSESQLSQKERKEQKEQTDRLQKDLDVMQQDLSSTQKKLSETEEKRATTQTELDKALERISLLEKQLESERATTATEKERLTKELESERNKVTELQEKVTHLEQEVARLQTALDAKNAPPENPKEPSAT